MEKITELEKLAKKIRLDVLKMTYEKKAGFIGTAFSCAVGEINDTCLVKGVAGAIDIDPTEDC